MAKVINYAPYVYACRTGMEHATKTFHVFILVPIPKSKSIHFFHRSASNIERGVSIAENTLGIHLQTRRGHSEFGDKITADSKAFWAGYLSFEYLDTDNIPKSDYEYVINIHKDKDGKPEKTISVLYGDAEELSQADFNELKDGDFALACPYAYLYQKEIKGKSIFFSQVLIPEVEKNAIPSSFGYNQKAGKTALLLPSRMLTSDNIAIQAINNEPFEGETATSFIEVATNVTAEGSLDFEYSNNQPLLKFRGGGGGGGKKRKKKMIVRPKPAPF